MANNIQIPGDSTIQVTPGTQTQPAPEPVQAQPSTQSRQPKQTVHQITQEGLMKMKKGEFNRGQQHALKMLDAEAQRLGYKDFEDMKNTRQIQNKPQQQPAQPARDGNNRRQDQRRPQHQHGTHNEVQRLQQRIEQLEEDKRKANRRAAQAERRVADMEKSMLAKEAEHELRLTAMRHGVHDIDYAVNLLRRQTSAMSEQELEAFDEGKFFGDTLRKSHPYLYGEEVRPAHTEPQAAAAPPAAPAPAQVQQQISQEKTEARDARSMTREEYQKHLATLGLTDPSITQSIPS